MPNRCREFSACNQAVLQPIRAISKPGEYVCVYASVASGVYVGKNI